MRWAKRAVRSYDGAGESGRAGPVARFLFLQQRYRLARRITPRRGEAAELVRNLKTFSETLGEKAGEGRRGEDEERLTEWAARCELYALRRTGRAAAAKKALGLYERLRERDRRQATLEEAAGIDVVVEIGRARCLRALGRMQEATAILTPLCSGLPRDSASFWTAQIERAECIAESEDRKKLNQLLALIRQLRQLDPNMGRANVEKRFNRLMARIEGELDARQSEK